MDQGYHQQQQHPHHISVNVDAGDRFPQWSVQETRDFLTIRAELDQTFMETKRNKLLWEVISNKMKEKGFNRSPDQCKCKWKNLVTRYKGCEVEGMRQQFPFYNEFQAIFTSRMQRMLWIEAEGSSAKKKGVASLSSDEEDENEESDADKSWGNKKRKKAVSKNVNNNNNPGNGSGSNVINGLKDILEEFTKQQMQMEMQWLSAYEAREEERRMREKEWKQRMEALENEKMMMDRRWREMEEQRRAKEEARAEKRDFLITQLLNKLTRDRDQERY